MQKVNCDTETGVCTPTVLNKGMVNSDKEIHTDVKIIYVGDPMCSWCYGIAPELKQLKDYYDKQGFQFEIIAGGLRPGGGDQWTPEFRGFLKHHWEEVEERSGQKFRYELFEREGFNYDTEPSCRAVVTAKKWLSNDLLAFFESIQVKFYLESEDPNQVEFYRSICEEFKIPFDEFKARFESKEMKEATHQEFVLNREWGVTGYPSVLIKNKDDISYVSKGYASFDKMKETIEKLK